MDTGKEEAKGGPMIGIAIAVALVVLGGASLAFSGNKEKDAPLLQEETATTRALPATEEPMADLPEAPTATAEPMMAGSYVPYASEKLSMAETGDVVLFFRASWCPSCRSLDADIRKNAASIPKGLTILDVDYDTSAELKKKYGVTSQHTLVQVAADGTMISSWRGSADLAALIAKVQ